MERAIRTALIIIFILSASHLHASDTAPKFLAIVNYTNNFIDFEMKGIDVEVYAAGKLSPWMWFDCSESDPVCYISELRIPYGFYEWVLTVWEGWPSESEKHVTYYHKVFSKADTESAAEEGLLPAWVITGPGFDSDQGKQRNDI